MFKQSDFFLFNREHCCSYVVAEVKFLQYLFNYFCCNFSFNFYIFLYLFW